MYRIKEARAYISAVMVLLGRPRFSESYYRSITVLGMSKVAKPSTFDMSYSYIFKAQSDPPPPPTQHWYSYTKKGVCSGGADQEASEEEGD